MSDSQPKIRPATQEDLESFYGHPPIRSVKAYVMDLGGKIIAVGGLAYSQGRPWDLFSDVTEEAKSYPLAMIRGARMVVKELNMGVAVADPNHKNSEKALRMIGLEYIGETASGKLYGRRT